MKCSECNGAGVEFRGSGNNAQYKVCSKWKEEGHPTKEEIQAKIRQNMECNMPASGRFA